MTARMWDWDPEAERLRPPVWTLDLQRFAAEDEGKTEQPTQRRLREARRQGRVAKTPELAGALTLLAGALYLLVTGRRILEDLMVTMARLLEAAGRPTFELTQMGPVLGDMGRVLLVWVLPLMLLVMAVSVLAEVAQVGVHWSFEPLKPSWEKVSFTWEKLQRKVLLSRPVLVGLVRTFLKLAAIGVVAALVMASGFGRLAGLVDSAPGRSVLEVSSSVFRLTLWTAVLFLVLAAADYFYQRFEFLESLKMTRRELKREIIEDEGNPVIKRRIMEMYRQGMQRRKMLADVPKADVVVTNPTHYAVALEYDSGRMSAPRVLAKGEDLLALKIREIALAHGVPLREDRYLARTLYERTEVGQEIPVELYEAVAAVFRYVYELKGRKAV